MNYNEMMRKVLEILPDAEVLEDNEGQLVIYSGLRIDPESDLLEELIPLEELEE